MPYMIKRIRIVQSMVRTFYEYIDANLVHPVHVPCDLCFYDFIIILPAFVRFCECKKLQVN